MRLFYTPDIEGDHYTLNPEESRHCVLVLRLKEKEVVAMVDGKGNMYTGEIEKANSKACSLKITDKKERFGQRPFHLHLAIAPTKNIDRTEWMLEKCTEIGIDEITLLNTERTGRRTVKMERLEKVIVAAMKQSLKAYLPQLNPMTDFQDFIGSCRETSRFIAHCHEGSKQRLETAYHPGDDTVILIGPEGDFSDMEAEEATHKGFVPITLGTSRLRTETAGIVACHSVNFLNHV